MPNPRQGLSVFSALSPTLLPPLRIFACFGTSPLCCSLPSSVAISAVTRRVLRSIFVSVPEALTTGGAAGRAVFAVLSFASGWRARADGAGSSASARVRVGISFVMTFL